MKHYSIPKLTGNKKNRDVKVFTAGRIILLTALALLCVFFLLIYLFLNFYRPSVNNTDIDFGDEFVNSAPDDGGGGGVAEAASSPAADSSKNKNNYTFLMLGKDNVGGTTDVMMIVMFNVKDNKISVLNIPRDTYVSTKNYSGKINGVYNRGYSNALQNGSKKEDAQKSGIEYLKAMIKYTFGMEINYHALIDLEGFRALVKSVGGVDMEVPQDMYYSDPDQNLYINLQAGWQHLDENQAEQLVRFRSGYLDADIGRIRTQQKFLAALMKKVLKFDVNNIKNIFDIGSKYMIANISTADAGWFAAKIINVKLEDIRTHTVPGNWIASVARYEVYKKETIEIINKYYNPYTKDIPESSFNIYDADLIGFGGYKPEINIDGSTLNSLIN